MLEESNQGPIHESGQEPSELTEFARLAEAYPDFFNKGAQLGNDVASNFDLAVPSMLLTSPNRPIGTAQLIAQGALLRNDFDHRVGEVDIASLPQTSDESLAVMAGILAGTLRAMTERARRLERGEGPDISDTWAQEHFGPK